MNERKGNAGKSRSDATRRTAPSTRVRTEIAVRAARLMAEDGVATPAQAKRKAGRSMGISAREVLPDDEEVIAALREHLALFEPEHESLLRELRQAALQVMTELREFNPVLIGAVADGSATDYSAIELQLNADSGKEVEIFLLNRNIRYQAEAPGPNYEASLCCNEWEPEVVLQVLKSGSGRTRPQASARGPTFSLKALTDLLDAD
jgi:hypothetical protein